MSAELQKWVKTLSGKPLPVLRSSRNALRHLMGKGWYNGSEITRHLAHDPLLCVQLLRHANQHYDDGRVATLEQAVVMGGEGILNEYARTLPILEEQLPEAALQPLRGLYRYAFHAGYLARDLTRQKRDHHYNDAYFAGLLRSLGEMLARIFAPRRIPAIVQLAAERGISRNQAAQDVLGFDFRRLSLVLARTWHLPALLQASLDEDHFQDKRTELVELAAGLTQAGGDLLEAGEDEPLLARTAELLGVGGDEVKVIFFGANAAAAAYLSERLPPVREDLVELFPAGPQDSFEGEQRATPAARPEVLTRLRSAFASEATDHLTPQRVLELFTSAVREGLGFDRVVFALLTPDHAMLQGRYFGGVGANSALHHFEFEHKGRTLFAWLMEKPSAVWLNRSNIARLAPLLTDHLRRVTEVEEFVAQSVFINGRPIGLCYADRQRSGRAIGEAEFKAFRANCQSLTRRLSSLSSASSGRAAAPD